MTKKSCLRETNIREMIWGDGGETTRDENRGGATRLETFGFRYLLLPYKVHRQGDVIIKSR